MYICRCGALIEDRDLGVSSSAMSLLLSVISRGTSGYESLFPRIVKVLHKIIVDNKSLGPEHHYYGIPAPWLSVKLLRALQYFGAPEDKNVSGQLGLVIVKIFASVAAMGSSSPGAPKTGSASAVQNASYAVLFEAMNLIIHLFSAAAAAGQTAALDSELLTQCSTMLGRFIGPKEVTNTRYMGLETMTHLVSGLKSADLIRPHQDVIMQQLKDADISIRRRALALVFVMCNKGNATAVVSERLLYLKDAEISIRPELVLKIAILAEKFAPDYSWYVDQILHLIALAGDHVSDDIWYRVVHIVTNNESLQKYSAETVFMELAKAKVHETMVKVGAYILGEFGATVARTAGMGPREQFNTLHRHFAHAGPVTKGILLTAYVKIANAYPEVRGPIAAVFEQHRNSINSEIQQRANEYANLLAAANISVAPAILDALPAFPPRENSLLKRLEQSSDLAADPRSKTLSSADLIAEAGLGAAASVTVAATSSSGAGAGAANTAVPTAQRPMPTKSLIDDSDSDDAPPPNPGARLTSATHGAAEEDLLGLGPTTDPRLVSQHQPAAARQQPSDLDILSAILPTAAEAAPGGGGGGGGGGEVGPAQLKQWFDRLCQQPDGILYEDAHVQIGVKSEWVGPRGRLALFFGSKVATELTGVTSAVAPMNELKVSATALVATLAPRAQAQQVYTLECSAPFGQAPALRITYQQKFQKKN